MERHCENPTCGKPLHDHYLIQVTTMHLRVFCDAECLKESERLHVERLLRGDGP